VARLGINSEIIENVELAVFDKDGTLMDLYKYWSGMVAFRVDLAQKKLGFDDMDRKGIIYTMGVDLDNQRLIRSGPVGLKKREIVMQAMIDALGIIGFKDTYDLCNECFREADELSIDHLTEIIKPINSLHEVIKGLDNRKCRIAVATTDKSDRARLAMKYMGIMDIVEVVIGAEMVERCKPAPDMIEMILSKTGIKRENTVMVGDALTDVEMGINAGVSASIGVCSGLTSRENLLLKTQYVVDDISMIKLC
jgi:phosphoglycolate phosphatase